MAVRTGSFRRAKRSFCTMRSSPRARIARAMCSTGQGMATSRFWATRKPACRGPRIRPWASSWIFSEVRSAMRNIGAAAATSANPMGTDGFEFVEYTAPDPAELRLLFGKMGFPAIAKHRSRNVTLHRQGDINFIINAEPDGFAQRFARFHGGSICAMAFRVKDAAFAYRRALALGAKPGPQSAGPMELNIPSIEGIGGSLIYLVHRYD